MDLYCADYALDLSRDTESVDICLERYPRDLGRALALAGCGRVSEGYAVLARGLFDAREIAHAPMQRLYKEALGVYEGRYGVAIN